MKLIALVFTLFSLPVFASPNVIHGELASPAQYPFACKVNVFYGDGDMNSCSGTLIDSKHILTAAHCFFPNFKMTATQTVSVVCGGKFLPSLTTVSLPTNVGEVISPISKKWIIPTLLDQSLLTFSTAATLQTLPKAIGPNLYFDSEGKLLPGVVCGLFGYGETRDSTRGLLHFADFKNMKVELKGDLGIVVTMPELDQALSISADQGDSGGTFYCKAPNHNAELVGVTNATGALRSAPDVEVSNYMSPVW